MNKWLVLSVCSNGTVLVHKVLFDFAEAKKFAGNLLCNNTLTIVAEFRCDELQRVICFPDVTRYSSY